MIARSLLIIFAINFSVLANEDKISLSLLNAELKKNYAFTERSLNQSAMKIDNSSGKIFFDETGITINILTPFKENYRIEGGIIEIHDLYLDQKQSINIDQANNFFLNLLIDGIDENNSTYQVNIVDDDAIEVMSFEQNNLVSFLFFKNKLELIRYTDSPWGGAWNRAATVMMTKLFFIALGGSLGAPLRYLINDSMKDFYFFMLPSGIMLVNFIGCFFIGIAMAYISDFKSNAYYLLIVGFLGSFTTMSAFSQQTIELLYNGKELNALIYVLASIITCLIGTFFSFLFV